METIAHGTGSIAAVTIVVGVAAGDPLRPVRAAPVGAATQAMQQLGLRLYAAFAAMAIPPRFATRGARFK